MPAPDPDARDAARAARGDTRAFERLYVAHAARVQTLARRMVGRDLADDATQDVFIHAWEHLGQFRGEARFGTWLHRLAVNLLLRRAEVARRITARIAPGTIEELHAPSSSPETRMDVDAALARLGPGLREVVVLHDLEGYRHEEIADVLAISVSASKMRLHRGRMLLREWLRP
ncbi:MAG TPA: RNA polymerase sigma factor [Gemmatimonadaceae bacterium]|nr:RNA polymerase sigma factor [Gemmatimonadaceae bacterium]